MTEANSKIEIFRKAKREYKYAVENMKDYMWMHSVDTLAKFKAKVKTRITICNLRKINLVFQEKKSLIVKLNFRRLNSSKEEVFLKSKMSL